MAKEHTYIPELKALVNAYGSGVVSKLLGVTERGMQYWTADKPKAPRSETQRTIHELFIKHEFGEDIRLSEKPGLKDELLQSYKDQVALLRGQVSLISAELKESVLINQSLLMTNQDLLIQLLALEKKQDSKKTAFEVGKVNALNYQRAKKKDIPVDVDK